MDERAAAGNVNALVHVLDHVVDAQFLGVPGLRLMLGMRWNCTEFQLSA